MPGANSVAEVNDSRELLRIDDVHAKAAEGDHDILRGFSLTVREGEIHAIMGPNGSGKSMLVKHVARFPGIRSNERLDLVQR